MLVLWLLTLIAASAGIAPAIQLATWFGDHVVATILLILFFG